MTSELVIDVKEKDISIALLEDKSLVEYQTESRSASFSVGNIYVAKIRKIMPGLNASFVDVGYERDAFLHYLDLGNKYPSYEKYLKQLLSDNHKIYPFEKALRLPDLKKDGSIASVLNKEDEVLVQIVKEPISTKGPRLTSDLSFAGRFIVLMPFHDKVSVSTKIKSSAERSRLKQIVQSVKPKNIGVIIRTVAEGCQGEELQAEMRLLMKKWEDVLKRVHDTKKRPQLVYEETSRAVALLRDLFNPTYSAVHVNDSSVYEEIREYISLIAPGKESIVKLYEGKIPIFDNFNVTKQLKSGFGKTVNYKHGAYLIIEHTEAMHVVDVNSGNRTRAENGQEQNALDVNLGAADELARQLRLRDMGGIIIVDFIDMTCDEHREAVLTELRRAVSTDRTRMTVSNFTELGLVEMTRKRTRESLAHVLCEPCPMCGGRGEIRTARTVCYSVMREIVRLSKQYRETKEFHIQASETVINMLLEEESAALELLQTFVEKPILLEVEPSYTQEQYDVILA